MTLRLVRVCCIVAVAALAAQCGGSSGPTGASQPVIQKAATASGDNQGATVGTALTGPLRVAVTLGGAPQQGTAVTWATAGTGASVNPASSVTDVDGIATTTWTLGQAAGTQHATASLAGATGSPVTFTAAAAAGAATQLALASGDNQADAPNSTLSGPLKAKVGDQFGNGVSGVTVAWQVTGGTATVQPASSATDASGIAQTVVTLGGALGAVTVAATSAGLTGSVTFHATVVSFPASASVQVGDNFFKSGRNNGSNPAVDTISAGGTVTWTWSGASSHSVQSTGSPAFTSSTITSSGTYAFTFATAGTYTYDCAVHGASMSGTVVVK
jgi:adhesin/invasin